MIVTSRHLVSFSLRLTFFFGVWWRDASKTPKKNRAKPADSCITVALQWHVFWNKASKIGKKWNLTCDSCESRDNSLAKSPSAWSWSRDQAAASYPFSNKIWWGLDEGLRRVCEHSTLGSKMVKPLHKEEWHKKDLTLSKKWPHPLRAQRYHQNPHHPVARIAEAVTVTPLPWQVW